MAASVWTHDRIDRLKTLWVEGQTAEGIARELRGGISRSAVLGKLRRLGLSTETRIARPKAAVKGGTARSSTGAPPCPATVPDGRPPLGGIGGGVGLLSVRRGQCRWPLGDPHRTDFILCGARVVRGVYCSGHAELAYRPVKDSARNLERLAGLT